MPSARHPSDPTKIESEVTPAIGGDGASEEILGFLLQGFDGDINRIWESNIFGRSLNDLAEDSITGRIRLCRKM